MRKSNTSGFAVHLGCVCVTIQNGVDAAVRGSGRQEEEEEKEEEKVLEGSLW